MGASIEHSLVSGVTARVFAHVMGDVPCFSYVTRGLTAFGQAELVFTLRRALQNHLEGAPQEPLDLLRTIAGLAQQGRLVSEGGITEVGPRGLFGRPQLRGLVYQRAWPMDGVELPEGCLAAICIVGHEMDTVKHFGSLRVLARLGAANRFFPTTPWCDPDRAPLMAPEQNSILDGVRSGQFSGVSVVMESERVAMRLPRTKQLPELPPPEVPLAFLTTLDARADACLVWSPGQQAHEAISPQGSLGARVSGCFVMFVPQQERDYVNVFEDGFVSLLTDRSWAQIRHALATRAPVSIPDMGGKRLAIEWFGPPAS